MRVAKVLPAADFASADSDLGRNRGCDNKKNQECTGYNELSIQYCFHRPSFLKGELSISAMRSELLCLLAKVHSGSSHYLFFGLISIGCVQRFVSWRIKCPGSLK